MEKEELMLRAMEARHMAYAPYTGFAVGAAPALPGRAGLYRLQHRKRGADGDKLCGAHSAFQGGFRG